MLAWDSAPGHLPPKLNFGSAWFFLTKSHVKKNGIEPLITFLPRISRALLGACPLSGAKRTWREDDAMSVHDAKSGIQPLAHIQRGRALPSYVKVKGFGPRM
jgi:hypothetical protein